MRGPAGPGAEIVRRPGDRSRRATRRWPPSARSATPRSSRPHARWARAAPTRSSPPARPARRSPRPRSPSSACAACSGPRSPCCCRCRAGLSCCSTRARASRCGPEHLVQFAYMGACFMEAVVGIERPRGRPAVGGRGVRARAPPTCSPPTSVSRSGTLNFVGNVEGFDLPDRRRRRGGHRRLHRQRRAQGARGHGPRAVRRRSATRIASGAVSSRRRTAHPRQAGRRCATTSTRSAWAARSCSGCASRW